jgi:hypothetical protein
VHGEHLHPLITDPSLAHYGVREMLRVDRDPRAQPEADQRVDRPASLFVVEIDNEVDVDRHARMTVQHDGQTPHDDVANAGNVQRRE